MGTPVPDRHAAVGVRTALAVLLACVFVLCAVGVSYSADIPIATIPVGDGPSAVAVDVVTNAVFVTDYNDDAVTVIDGVSDTVTATVPMPPTATQTFPIAVVTDPTRGLAYVADFWQGQVVQISEPGYSVTASMPGAGSHGEAPRALAIDPASTPPKLYVANYGSDSVTVLNALTMARIAEIPVGDAPRAIAIFTSAGRRRVFVGNRYTNNVTIIDGDTGSVVGTVTLDGPPKAIAVNGAGGKAYVTVPATDRVFVIGTTDTVVATITVGDNPVGIDFRSSQYGLVACYAGREADVIDANTDSVVATVPTGPGPFNVTAAPLDAKWYVTNKLGSTVNVVSSGYGVTTVAVGAAPYQVAVNELLAPREAYCSNFTSDTVT
ncbi:MAG: YncE family protein, partial [Actinobacteria bacterium]